MVLSNIPMPPSSNKIYATSYKTGRRFKTTEATKFESDFSKWTLTHEYQLGCIKIASQSIDPKNLRLIIKTKFKFTYSQLFTKKGIPKKLDLTNRNKMLYDQLCKAVNIDDKYIFKTIEEKLVDDACHCEVELDMIDLNSTS